MALTGQRAHLSQVERLVVVELLERHVPPLGGGGAGHLDYLVREAGGTGVVGALRVDGQLGRVGWVRFLRNAQIKNLCESCDACLTVLPSVVLNSLERMKNACLLRNLSPL